MVIFPLEHSWISFHFFKTTVSLQAKGFSLFLKITWYNLSYTLLKKRLNLLYVTFYSTLWITINQWGCGPVILSEYGHYILATLWDRCLYIYLLYTSFPCMPQMWLGQSHVHILGLPLTLGEAQIFISG